MALSAVTGAAGRFGGRGAGGIAALAALLAISAPAQATITILSADFSWTISAARYGGGGGSDLVALGTGLTQISRSYYGFAYDVCDHHEDECAGLKYAGARVDANWSIDFTPHRLDYSFNVFQGSDIGAASEDHMLEIWLVSDRAIKIFSRDAGHVWTSADCYDCSSSFGSGTNSWEDGGLWWTQIDSYGQASVSSGEQRLSERFGVSLAEVPEPQSWALMIAGFGLVGGALRQRRRAMA